MISLLLGLLVFLVPSNLFLKIAEETAYVRGLQIDYLIPKIALSELVVFALITALIWDSRAHVLKDFTQMFHQMVKSGVKNKVAMVLVGLTGLLVVRQFFTKHPLASIDVMIDIGALALLAFFSQYRRTQRHFAAFFTSQWFLWTLLTTLLFQSSLAIYQFLAQKSLLGYWFLGEGNIQALSNVSRISWFGAQLVAPMGTTAHANVLGGVLAIYLGIFAWRGGEILGKIKRHQAIIRLVLTCVAMLGLVALVLTASLTGWLTLGMFILTWQMEQRGFFSSSQARYVPIVLVAGALFTTLVIGTAAQQFPKNDSLTRRAYLSEAAWNMWLDHPWTGVGLQNATGYIEQYSNVREIARFTQPPHTTWLLWLAETGVVGFLVVGAMLWLSRNVVVERKILLLFFITFFVQNMDHYLLNISSGRELLLLLFLVL